MKSFRSGSIIKATSLLACLTLACHAQAAGWNWSSVKVGAGRWQKTMESEDGLTQAVKAEKTFCDLSELGIEPARKLFLFNNYR